MSHDIDVVAGVKRQIVVPSFFAAKEPLNLKQLRKATMIDTGKVLKGPFEQYAKVDEEQVESAIEELQQDLESGNSWKWRRWQEAGGCRIM